WHQKSALPEQLGQANRLKQARLAARVGAGDDHQGARLRFQAARTRSPVLEEQERIEQVDQLEIARWRHELGQAHFETLGPGEVSKRAGGQVKFQVAAKLEQPRGGILDLVEDAVDQPPHQLGLSKAI